MGFIDFIYYNVIGSALSISLFVGMEFVSDPKNFKQNLENYLYNLMDYSLEKYVLLKEKYEEIKDLFEDKEKNIVLFDDIKYIHTSENKLKQINGTKQYWKKHIIGKKTYYSNGEQEQDSIEKLDFPPFMSFELHIEEELNSIENTDRNVDLSDNHFNTDKSSLTNTNTNINIFDVYENMKHFFIKGNKINHSFMKKFMSFYYNINITKYKTLYCCYMTEDFETHKDEIKSLNISL